MMMSTDRQQLKQSCVETLDRLIREKKHDALTTSDARKAVYKDILLYPFNIEGFRSLSEAREYIEGQPDDNVIFTAHGDEISFLLIRIVIDDIERNPWLSPFRAARPDIGRQPPLIPAAIPADGLQRIASRYGWWAARQAAALCPRNDVACVEREAKRLYEVVRLRKAHGN